MLQKKNSTFPKPVVAYKPVAYKKVDNDIRIRSMIVKIRLSKNECAILYQSARQKNENIMLAVIHLAHTQDFPKNQHFFTPHPHPVYLIVF